MQCFECKRDIKGGFGVGPKPYTLFRFAGCVIESVDFSSMLHAFALIKEECEKPSQRTDGYKPRFLELKDRMRTIAITCEYHLTKNT